MPCSKRSPKLAAPVEGLSLPCAVMDRSHFGGGARPCLVLAESFEGYMLAYRPLAVEAWGDLFVHLRWVPTATVGPGKQYCPVEAEKYPLQSVLNRYREVIVEKGGVPEAVRLLDHFLRFTDEEKKTMADKLAKKGAAAPKADAKTTKAPAAGGKKGNPEALKKAREQSDETRAARQAELLKDKRKITATDKGKAKIAKAGKEDKLSRIVAAKTVGAAMAIDDVKFADITYAERVGLITLG